MKKKILFVIDSLVCGGAEKSLVSLLPLLSREKYEIHLWILHRGEVLEKLLTNDVIVEQEPKYCMTERIKMQLAQIRYSVLFRLIAFLGKKEHMAETLWRCVENIYKVPEELYDIAVAYQQGLPTYLVATKINAYKRIAWINADIFAAGYSDSFNIKFYNKLDVIVPVSNKLEAILIDRYPQYKAKYRCIYDILNPELIMRQSHESVKETALWNNKTVIVTTGRLAVAKNHLLAVEAAKQIQEQGYDFIWLFVGEGEERSNIEKLIQKYGLEKQVIILGERTNPYPYMASSTIYVQTSSFEGYGLTIAEAKILGKPIVSTNFDVVYDQLKHGENGLIADMTPESVANNIIRMIEDTRLRNYIVDNVKKEKNTTYMTEIRKIEFLFDAD